MTAEAALLAEGAERLAERVSALRLAPQRPTAPVPAGGDLSEELETARGLLIAYDGFLTERRGEMLKEEIRGLHKLLGAVRELCDAGTSAETAVARAWRQEERTRFRTHFDERFLPLMRKVDAYQELFELHLRERWAGSTRPKEVFEAAEFLNVETATIGELLSRFVREMSPRLGQLIDVLSGPA